MIIFSTKKIHYWSKWRTKSKFLFCIAFGFLYSLIGFILTLIFKSILGHNENLLETSLYSSIGSFLAGSFLSIALWYENERRFKIWKTEEDKKPTLL